MMDLSPANCFNLTLSSQDASAMGDLGFERLNRKPNFSSKETQFIIDMVRKFKTVLTERSLDSGTNERKRWAWQMICDGVNEMTPGVVRSVEEVRKRWQNLNCTARKEAAKLKKYQSEGLTPPPMSSVSLQILGSEDGMNLDETGHNPDLVVQSMKIEIDMATDASDDNSITDFPNFSELSESPVNCSDSIKNDLALTNVQHVQGDASSSISEPLTLQSSDAVCSDSSPSQNLTISSQSTKNPNLPSTKVTSSGPSACSTPIITPNNKRSHESTYTSLTPKHSIVTSHQNGISTRNIKTHMCNDSEFNSVSSNGMRQHDGMKRRRTEDHRFRIQEELLSNERDALSLEREKVQLEREKLNMEQEQLAVELQKVLMEKEKLNLEKEVEREKVRMEREKLSLEMQQERQKLALERERLDLARDQGKTRLKLDQEKLNIEKEKIALEQEKLGLEIRYWKQRLLQIQSDDDSSPVNGSS